MLLILLCFNSIVHTTYSNDSMMRERKKTSYHVNGPDHENNSSKNSWDTCDFIPHNNIISSYNHNLTKEILHEKRDLNGPYEKLSPSSKIKRMDTTICGWKPPLNEQQTPQSPLELLHLIKTKFEDCGNVYKHFSVLVSCAISCIVKTINIELENPPTYITEKSLMGNIGLYAEIFKNFVHITEKKNNHRESQLGEQQAHSKNSSKGQRSVDTMEKPKNSMCSSFKTIKIDENRIIQAFKQHDKGSLDNLDISYSHQTQKSTHLYNDLTAAFVCDDENFEDEDRENGNPLEKYPVWSNNE